MRLVVNTNRIIAALIKDSWNRKILFSDKIEFLTIGIAKSEVEEHKKELLEKAKISEEELNEMFSILFSKIFVVSDIVIQSKMKEAKEIMDMIDPSDTPFIALALSVENDGIWTNDKHFERQKTIPVWKTEKILEIIK